MNEIFTCEKPFVGTHPIQAAREVAQNGHRPDIRKVQNATLRKLIRACWQEDEKRRPNWDLIIGVLQEVLEDLSQPTAASNSSASVTQSHSSEEKAKNLGGARSQAAPAPAAPQTGGGGGGGFFGLFRKNKK